MIDVLTLTQVYEEDISDKELIEHFGWECDCGSPLELQHGDGSFARGSAAYTVLASLREEFA